MRPAKTLAEHVRAASFRPARHGPMLCGRDLPIRPDCHTLACERLWHRLRSLQTEYREAAGVDLKHDIAREFSTTVNQYHAAAARGHRDPFVNLPGVLEVTVLNRSARRVYDAEQECCRELSDDERAAIMRQVRRELRAARQRARTAR